MVASVKTSGSQTAVISTEHDLATVTDAGDYEINVDVANLVDGDSLELRIYGKARSTDTERLAYFGSFENAQTELLKKSLLITSPHHMRVTLKQTAGTGRAFPWAIYVI